MGSKVGWIDLRFQHAAIVIGLWHRICAVLDLRRRCEISLYTLAQSFYRCRTNDSGLKHLWIFSPWRRNISFRHCSHPDLKSSGSGLFKTLQSRHMCCRSCFPTNITAARCLLSKLCFILVRYVLQAILCKAGGRCHSTKVYSHSVHHRVQCVIAARRKKKPEEVSLHSPWTGRTFVQCHTGRPQTVAEID